MNKQNDHIAFLDHLRGVAIIAVFLCHAQLAVVYMAGHSNWISWNGLWNSDLAGSILHVVILTMLLGWTGVPLFFVISGFCIHLSFQRSRLRSWKEFFLRRFFRLYPPYLAALLFLGLILPYSRLHFGTTAHDFNEARDSIQALTSHLFLVHHFQLANDVSPAFWSIAVEVKLYVLYPILVWLALRFGWLTTICCTAAIEIGMRSLQIIYQIDSSLAPSPWFAESPWYFWYGWSMGAWLAEAYLEGRPLPFLRLPLVVCPIAFALCEYFEGLLPFCFLLACLFSAQIVARLLQSAMSPPSVPAHSRFIRVVLDHLQQIGIVSYSIYLLHYPLINTFYLLVQDPVLQVFNHHSTGVVALLFVGVPIWFAVFYLSKLFYRFVERTSIGWGNAIIQRNRV